MKLNSLVCDDLDACGLYLNLCQYVENSQRTNIYINPAFVYCFSQSQNLTQTLFSRKKPCSPVALVSKQYVQTNYYMSQLHTSNAVWSPTLAQVHVGQGTIVCCRYDLKQLKLKSRYPIYFLISSCSLLNNYDNDNIQQIVALVIAMTTMMMIENNNNDNDGYGGGDSDGDVIMMLVVVVAMLMIMVMICNNVVVIMVVTMLVVMMLVVWMVVG